MTNNTTTARCLSGRPVTSVASVCLSVRRRRTWKRSRGIHGIAARDGRIPRGGLGSVVPSTHPGHTGDPARDPAPHPSRGKTTPPNQQGADSDLYSSCARRSNSTLLNVGSSSTPNNLTWDQRRAFFSLFPPQPAGITPVLACGASGGGGIKKKRNQQQHLFPETLDGHRKPTSQQDSLALTACGLFRSNKCSFTTSALQTTGESKAQGCFRASSQPRLFTTHPNWAYS